MCLICDCKFREKKLGRHKRGFHISKWICAGWVEVTWLPPPSSIFHSVLAFSSSSKKGGIVQKWVTTAVGVTGPRGLIDAREDNYWSNLNHVWCWWMSVGSPKHLSWSIRLRRRGSLLKFGHVCFADHWFESSVRQYQPDVILGKIAG